PSPSDARRSVPSSCFGAAIAAAGMRAMQAIKKFRVLFVAGFGPIVRDAASSRKLYQQVLEIPFKEENGGYLHTEALKGAKTFALWPLPQAAQSCFGTESWPKDISVPQAWLEFDVDDVEMATSALESQGYQMLVKNKKEPWGQTVSRFITPEGLLIGVTFTPSMRRDQN
ncbi:MAG: VOC family protein, partial [Terriglobales bacterium]